MEKQLELIIKDDENKLVLSNAVDILLDVCEDDYQKAVEQYDLVKSELLKAMIDNGLKKAETAHFKVSCRENRQTWLFDEERFKKEESKDIVEAFTVKETTREMKLNVDRLKEQYPEVYEKCLDIETKEVVSIDEHKLWKDLNVIWKKYATEIKPDKIGTIKIERKSE